MERHGSQAGSRGACARLLRATALQVAAVALLAGAATAQDLAPITEVTDASPARIVFDCAGVKGPVVLDLRKDLDEDFYIQEAAADVAIPVTCATAPIGLSGSSAAISCNKSVSGTETMGMADGRDLADALARAIGAASCRRTR